MSQFVPSCLGLVNNAFLAIILKQLTGTNVQLINSITICEIAHDQRAPNVNCSAIVLFLFFFLPAFKNQIAVITVSPHIITTLTHIHNIWLVYPTGSKWPHPYPVGYKQRLSERVFYVVVWF